MNERIEQLAKKAGFGVYGEIYSPNDEDSPITKNIEKFAELVVGECIKVIETNHPEFDCKESADNLIRRAGRMDAIDEISKHFGVEQ